MCKTTCDLLYLSTNFYSINIALLATVNISLEENVRLIALFFFLIVEHKLLLILPF